MFKNDNRLVKDTRSLGDEVLVIDSRNDIDDSQKKRKMSPEELFKLKKDTGLDIILISNDNNLPVVKLIDYGKLKYEEEKRKKEQHKNTNKLKEFYFNLNIGEHDYQTKLKHIIEALEKKYTVRAGVKMNYNVKMALPRGKSLKHVYKEEDFILNKVIRDIKEIVKDTIVKVTDNMVFVDLVK